LSEASWLSILKHLPHSPKGFPITFQLLLSARYHRPSWGCLKAASFSEDICGMYHIIYSSVQLHMYATSCMAKCVHPNTSYN